MSQNDTPNPKSPATSMIVLDVDSEATDIEALARDFARQLVEAKPERRHEAREAVEQMGRPLQQETARRSEMLRTPLHELAGHADDGGPVASSLLELRHEVESLDPARFNLEPGWAMRLVGKIPGIGTPVRRYFQRFESAQDTLAAIDASLVKGRGELERDNVTLASDQGEMQALAGRLEHQAALGRALDAALTEKIETRRTEGTQDPAHIETELLFPLRQRLMDLEQQRAVTQQGIMASNIVRRNNVELIRAVDRARNVTMNALQVAVTVALALNNQKLVLDKVTAVNTATSAILASNAQRLKAQGAAIHAQASSTMLDMNALKSAFQDIHETMEAIATHRREALPEMARALVELDTMTREGETMTQTIQPRAQSGYARMGTLAACTIVALLALLTGGCGADTDPKSTTGKTLTEEEAGTKLASMLERIKPDTRSPDWRETIRIETSDPIEATLPDIETFEWAVDPRPCGQCITATIVSSTEKAGQGSDGWIVETAKAFNANRFETDDGRTMQVAVQAIPSGTAYQMMAAGKTKPDGFTPSNHLWIAMLQARGVDTEAVTERLVGNTAGIVMRETTSDMLSTQTGGTPIEAEHVVEAVNAGELTMGYTNPFASSTGLNFLITVLDGFADGDPGRILSEDVTSAFTTFQQSVPFIALTTLQMRASVESGGRLDAFVMERQTFANTPSLATDYVFVPFGIAHDNPLYAIGKPTKLVREVLRRFAEHALDAPSQALAMEYGFGDGSSGPDPAPSPYAGETLIEAQALWKTHKDAGRPVSAVFVADVSGSMRGSRLTLLKSALRAGAAFIKPESAIGLVEFNDDVTIRIPIAAFDLNQQGSFLAAVKEMEASGGTAMYDGILVGLSMLAEARRNNPSTQPIMIALSDGKSTSGHTYRDVHRIVKAMQIPVYTIGYEADIETLAALSALVEAASLKGTEERIAHQIGTLLNAQM